MCKDLIPVSGHRVTTIMPTEDVDNTSSSDLDSLERGELPPSSSNMRSRSTSLDGAMRGLGIVTPEMVGPPPENTIGTDDVVIIDLGEPSSSEDRGSGGCCSWWTRGAQMLKAGLVQSISTALTFGTKPLVEAAVLSAFGVTSTASVPIAAALTTAIVGGAYAGLVHTTVSNIVSGLMNSALSVMSYEPMEGSNSFLGELFTVDAPVMGAFVGGYALRGMVMEGEESVWLDALSKSITSTSAGFLQGMVTDALRQTMVAYEAVYKEKMPPDLEGGKLDFVKKTFKDTVDVMAMSGKDLGHNIYGKTVGSTLGMLYPQLYKNVDMSAPVKGAVGMTTYLTSWFSGIHIASTVMDKVWPKDTPPLNDAPPQLASSEDHSYTEDIV